MTKLLFAGSADEWDDYREALPSALKAAGVDAKILTECDPVEVDYMVYSPAGGISDFAPYTRLKAVFSLWAGVEKIVGNTSLQVPLCRMVDAGLTEGMVKWCLGHVMRHHLGMDRDIRRTNTDWEPAFPPLARGRQVVILGMGALGQAVAETLRDLRFQVTGWSRSLKAVEGVRCLSGNEGLRQAMERAEILVLLLPMTPATENLLDAAAFNLLPDGAMLINPGRGPLIDDDALLSALDSGKVAHATLYLFRVEPLSKDHPYWAHPKVTVTPHIASVTRPETAAQVVVENLRRAMAGEELLHLVDRSAGY